MDYSSSDPSSPYLINSLAGKNIVDIDCGDFHTMALDDQGQVYSWGGGTSTQNKGQCGHGHLDETSEPQLIEYFEHTQIS